MRRSEICALKFTDIDLDKSLIHIRRTMVKDDKGEWIVQERTKTVKSKRDVTLPPVCLLYTSHGRQPVENAGSGDDGHHEKVDGTAAGLEPDSRTAVRLLCRTHARITPPGPDVKGLRAAARRSDERRPCRRP